MVLKKTSEDGFVFPRSIRPKGAILADFDIDGHSLKKLHRDWLEDNVVKPAHAKSSIAGSWAIDLIGRASKTGSDEHNMWLSGKRVEEVIHYLGPRLSGAQFFFRPARLGESSPYNSSEFEHELDRSVEIRAEFFATMAPKRRKPHILIPKFEPWNPPPNKKVTDFRLQVLAAYIFIRTLDVKLPLSKVGQGHSEVKLLINIRELGSTDHALYDFLGTGTGMIVGPRISIKGPWKSILPIGSSTFSSKYGKGREHPFATDVEMDADDFEGPAFFQFDLLGRTLGFGPKPRFFGSQGKIKGLSFGPEKIKKLGVTDYAEGTCFGKMSVVSSVPSWAK